MPDKYNGWTNWETWNVALWINNDLNIYLGITFVVTAIMSDCEGPNCNRDCCTEHLYDSLISELNLKTKSTPDRVPYSLADLDRKSLNEMLRSMALPIDPTHI